MSWIDLKVRKPTEADADENNEVLWQYGENIRQTWHWDYELRDAVAWMPIPEFTPIPDPPDGYEFLEDYDAAPHPDAMHWNDRKESWEIRAYPSDAYNRAETNIYAVPVKPPAPQYRPFANAEEFRPFRDRWWKKKIDDRVYPPESYTEKGLGFAGCDWQHAFDALEFDDGTPFGLPIES